MNGLFRFPDRNLTSGLAVEKVEDVTATPYRANGQAHHLQPPTEPEHLGIQGISTRFVPSGPFAWPNGLDQHLSGNHRPGSLQEGVHETTLQWRDRHPSGTESKDPSLVQNGQAIEAEMGVRDPGGVDPKPDPSHPCLDVVVSARNPYPVLSRAYLLRWGSRLHQEQDRRPCGKQSITSRRLGGPSDQGNLHRPAKVSVGCFGSVSLT